MPFKTITKENVGGLSDALLVAAIAHYRVIEGNAIQGGHLARGLHRRRLAASCGAAKQMLEEVLWPEQDRRRRPHARC